MTENGDPTQGAPSPWTFHEQAPPVEPAESSAGAMFGGTRAGAIPPAGSADDPGSYAGADSYDGADSFDGAGSLDDAGAYGGAGVSQPSEADVAGLAAGRHSDGDHSGGGYPEVHYYAHPGLDSPDAATEQPPEPVVQPGQFPSAEFGSPFGLPPDAARPAEDVQARYGEQPYPAAEARDAIGQTPTVQEAPPYPTGPFLPVEYPTGHYPASQYPQAQYAQAQYAQAQYAQAEYPATQYPTAHYSPEQYRQDQYPQDEYPQDQYAQDQYAQDQYAQDQYAQDQYAQDEYPPAPYPQDRGDPGPENPGYGQPAVDGTPADAAQIAAPQSAPSQYPASQYPASQYPAAQPVPAANDYAQAAYPATPGGPSPATYAPAPQQQSAPAAVPQQGSPQQGRPQQGGPAHSGRPDGGRRSGGRHTSGVPVPPPSAQPRPESLLVPSHRAKASKEAQGGWQGRIRRLSGGAIKPAPSSQELAARQDAYEIQRTFSRPMTIVVVQPKGGAGKTPTTIGLASALGAHRGGYVVGWDDNETRGTLAVRVDNADHQTTTVWDLLRDLPSFERTDARVGDLSHYVRGQGAAQFDALVSDDSPGNMAQIGESEFHRIHAVLQRFYRQIVVDTGNNVRSPNWQAAVNAADQIVVVSTYSRDVGYSGSWVLDHLIETGRSELAASAITVLSAADPRPDPTVRAELIKHFDQRTRAVVEIPYDPLIALGGPIEWSRLKSETRRAWTHAGAAVVNALAAQDESERVAKRG